MRIFRNAWFASFARREGISDEALREAVARAERGLIDADLGNGLIKQRVPRSGGGRSGGFRTIVMFRAGARAVFVFGFAKSDRDNLTRDELAAFRKAAKLVLAFPDEAMEAECRAGRMSEVTNDQDL